MKSRALLLVVAFVVLAMPLGFWLWVRVATRSSYASQQLAALRAQGQPVSLSDLAGQPVAAADNVSAGLDALAPQLRTFEPAVAAFLNDADKPGWPTAEQLAAATAALAGHDALFVELGQVAKRPVYQPIADYTRPPSAVTAEALERQQRNRLALRLLAMRARTQLAAGQVDEARQTCLTMLRLARKTEREPFLTGCMVACALRRTALQTLADTLAAAEPSAADRQALVDELALHNPQAALRHGLATERAFGIASFEELKSQGPGWLMAWYWNDDLSRYLTLLEQSSGSAQEKAAASSAHSSQDSKFLGTLTKNVAPAVAAALKAGDGDLASLRSARVLLALAGRTPTDGALPTAVDLALSASDLADPFSKGSLRIKSLPTGGWLIYSLGPDGNDDGGDPKRDRTLQATPASPQ